MNSLLGGDFRFFWPENVGDFVHLPFAWDSVLNTGLGTSDISTLWINSYLNLTASLTKFGLSWDVISFVFWLLPVFLFSFISASFLFHHLFPQQKWYSLLAGLVYSANTYILMVAFGGQLGVALAYSFAPFAVWAFVRGFEKTNLKNSLIAGLILSVQLLFDPRLVYLTLILILGYWIFVTPTRNIKAILLQFGLPLLITLLLHSFWLLPLLFYGDSSIAHNVGTTSAFVFFSFADFSHSLSLLQPNWPENIFGKVSFMKPEFLILPILAYASLLFVSNNDQNKNVTIKLFNHKTILYFALLGLIGAFLAKGATDPFSGVTIWIFNHVPGMQLFRDSTKWYLLIAVAYSVLIPFSIWHIYEWLKKHAKYTNISRVFNVQNIFLTAVVLFLLFLITPIFSQQSARPRQLPIEYIQLKNFLLQQNSFSRTLWIPEWQRFGYLSNEHPAVRFEELYDVKKDGSIAQWLQSPNRETELQSAGIKYLVVPYDSEGEIFLSDRKYDDKKYLSVVKALQKVSWLKKTKSFGKITVFEIAYAKDHFWSTSPTEKIQYTFVNPTRYLVTVANAKKGDKVIFAESFDKNWVASFGSGILSQESSSTYDNLLNSFILPKDGSYAFEISYVPQKYVDIGLWISLGMLILVLGSLIALNRRKNETL